MNHFLGYYLIETKGDQPEAQNQTLAYVDKSIQTGRTVRHYSDGKTNGNYYLRSFIYTKLYLELAARHIDRRSRRPAIRVRT